MNIYKKDRAKTCENIILSYPNECLNNVARSIFLIIISCYLTLTYNSKY